MAQSKLLFGDYVYIVKCHDPQMVHPEGQLYFYQPVHRLVTEEYLFDRLTFVRITFWLEKVSQLLNAQHMVPPLSSELFLELDEETQSCKYYFVDHAMRGLFWLDGGRTDELDLPPVSSDDHLSEFLRNFFICIEHPFC